MDTNSNESRKQEHHNPKFDYGSIRIRPYSLKELAVLYGVDKRTFAKWIETFCEGIGERIGRFYTAAQVKAIIKSVGRPRDAVEEDFD